MLLAQVLDELADRPDLVGIESVCWFVQNEQGRVVNESVGETHPLTVSFGKGLDHLATDIGQAAGFHHFPESLAEPASRKTSDRSPKTEILPDPHVGIERDVFRHVADLFANLEGFPENVFAGNPGCSRRGRQESGEHPESGRFAGAIGPKKAHDFATGDFKGYFVDCLVRAIALTETGNLDHAIFLMKNRWCGLTRGGARIT